MPLLADAALLEATTSATVSGTRTKRNLITIPLIMPAATAPPLGRTWCPQARIPLRQRQPSTKGVKRHPSAQSVVGDRESTMAAAGAATRRVPGPLRGAGRPARPTPERLPGLRRPDHRACGCSCTHTHYRIPGQHRCDPITQADAYRQARIAGPARPRRSVSPVLTTKRVTAVAAARTAATGLTLALPGPVHAAHHVPAANRASHLLGSHTAIKSGASQVKWQLPARARSHARQRAPSMPACKQERHRHPWATPSRAAGIAAPE